MYIMMRRSTKKVLLFLSCIFLFLLGYWVFKNSLNIPVIKEQSLIACIPVNTNKPLAAVVGIRDFKHTYNRIKTTNFYKSLINEDEKETGFKIAHSIDSELADKLNVLKKETLLAVYGKKVEELECIVISRIGSMTKLKHALYKISGKAVPSHEKYKGKTINKYHENLYYSMFSRIMVISNSKNMIKKVIDIKNPDSELNNFIMSYPWVKDKMDLSSDVYIFSSSKPAIEIINEIAGKKFKFQTLITYSAESYIYSELFFNKGVYMKSYSREDKSSGDMLHRTPVAIRFLPGKLLIAGFNAGIDTGLLKVLRYINIDVENDFIPYFADEFGYAILGPSVHTINLALPGLVIYGQVKDSESYGKIEGKIKEALGLRMEKAKYSGVKYNTASIPVFMGQNIEICTIGLKVKGKRFIAVTTSKKITEDIIDIVKGKKKSFKSSPSWREISRFLPKKFSNFSFADLNALSRTVGMFIARYTANRPLENLLKRDPFSWIGPTGSTRISDGEYLEVYTYIPMQDLTVSVWEQILEALPE